MSPAQALVAKLAADVAAAASSAGQPTTSAPVPKQPVTGVIQMQCDKGHKVVPVPLSQGGHKHLNHEDCDDRNYRAVRQSQVSSTARAAYLAMRNSQKAEARARDSWEMSRVRDAYHDGVDNVPLSKDRRPQALGGVR